MHTSRPIEVQGRFLGVAITDGTAWRFVATDPVIEDLDGATFPSLTDVERVARLALFRNGIRVAADRAHQKELAVSGWRIA